MGYGCLLWLTENTDNAIGRTDQNGEGGGGGNSIMVFLEVGDYIDFRFSASDNTTLDVWQVTAAIVRIHA